MADATWPLSYSAGDETVAALDRLHATRQEARSRQRASLDAVVARLDGTSLVLEDEPLVRLERRERPADRSPEPSDPQPFVALPQRTTHGGNYGPKVRDKLTREALARQAW